MKVYDTSYCNKSNKDRYHNRSHFNPPFFYY